MTKTIDNSEEIKKAYNNTINLINSIELDEKVKNFFLNQNELLFYSMSKLNEINLRNNNNNGR